jgi:predicted dehydrogenase
MHMQKIRLGIIGCGGIMNAHVNGWAKFDDIEVVCVADPVRERAEAMAKKMGAKGVYADHNALFDAEKKLDALFIAVPPAEHKGIEEIAIERKWNFKVEKPMTLDGKQAAAIAAGAEKAGIITAVGFQDRYMEISDRIKEALGSIDVGIVHGTWAGGIPRVYWWIKYPTCGGQLTEQNIHLVDMLRFFFGEIKEVYAKEVKVDGLVNADADCPGYENQDASVAMFTMESGVVATMMSACYLIGGSVNPVNGLTIIGRQCTIEYNLRRQARFITQDSDLCYMHNNDQMADSDRAFFDAVKKGDPSGIRSTYGDALRSLQACLAANESMASGKPVIL